MQRTVAVVQVPAWLRAQEVLGEPVVARWQRVCAAAGLHAVVQAPDDPVEGALVVDGRALSLAPGTLRRVADGVVTVVDERRADETVRLWVARRVGSEGAPAVERLEGELVDTPAALDRVERALAEALRRGAVAHGVRLVGEGMLLAPTVSLAPGCTVWHGAVLLGTTRVAEGAVIHPGCVLRDADVGPDAVLLAHTVAEGATIGPGTRVGPFAHLRPGTVLDEGSRIGNFVETKNTRLGAGAKANHLAYLGDAEVGEGSNIGAGTITCNYDGARKHRTHVGAGVFVGTNTSLVAPVRVGDGALVAAGSVITDDVPAGALAIARPPQRTLAGKGAVLLARNRAARDEAEG